MAQSVSSAVKESNRAAEQECRCRCMRHRLRLAFPAAAAAVFLVLLSCLTQSAILAVLTGSSGESLPPLSLSLSLSPQSPWFADHGPRAAASLSLMLTLDPLSAPPTAQVQGAEWRRRLRGSDSRLHERPVHDLLDVRTHDEDQVGSLGGALLFKHLLRELARQRRHQADPLFLHALHLGSRHVLPPEPDAHAPSLVLDAGSVRRLTGCAVRQTKRGVAQGLPRDAQVPGDWEVVAGKRQENVRIRGTRLLSRLCSSAPEVEVQLLRMRVSLPERLAATEEGDLGLFAGLFCLSNAASSLHVDNSRRGEWRWSITTSS